MLHLLCCLLPRAHRDSIEVIFIFLKWVATFSHVDEETGSKMDMGNLATVICPNILYSKGNNPTTDNSFMAIRTLHELLEHQDRFWTVPAELSAILENPDLFSNPELTSKDILRTCASLCASAFFLSSSAHTVPLLARRPRDLSVWTQQGISPAYEQLLNELSCSSSTSPSQCTPAGGSTADALRSAKPLWSHRIARGVTTREAQIIPVLLAMNATAALSLHLFIPPSFALCTQSVFLFFCFTTRKLQSLYTRMSLPLLNSFADIIVFASLSV